MKIKFVLGPYGYEVVIGDISENPVTASLNES